MSGLFILLICLKMCELELYIAEESHCNMNKSAGLVYHKANFNHAISNNNLSANLMQKSLGHAAETITRVFLCPEEPTF